MVLHIKLSREKSINDKSPVMFVLAAVYRPPGHHTDFIKGDLTHTVSPNLMLILSTYRVVLHPSYLQKVFSFIIFIKERYRFTILSEKSRAPGGVPCGRS